MSAFDRSKSLGGSDVAAICGLSQYRSGVHVKAEKVGEPLEKIVAEENRFIFWGLTNEPALRKVYASKNGLGTLYEKNGSLCIRWKKGCKIEIPEPKRHKDHPWAHASPDGIVTTPDGTWGLEIKTASQWKDNDWGLAGTGEKGVPHYYMTQVLWYMWVYGLDRWDVFVLIGGNDDRQYTIERTPDLEESIEKLTKGAERWWIKHIIEDQPVAYKGTPADMRAINTLHPEDVDEIVDAMPEVTQWAIEAAKCKRKIKEAEKSFDRYKTLITGYMGDAGTLDCEDVGKLTFKAPKPKKKTDWTAVAMRLYEMVADSMNFDDDDLKYLVLANTKETKGARRFSINRINFKGESNE